jgi:AraC-like DNA-binding protein
MRPAASVRDFLEQPHGRYFQGRRHAMFARSPSLIGFIAWGYPDTDDVRELLTLCEIGVAPDAVPHRFLVDVRELSHIDARTFAMFVEYTTRHRALLAKNVVCQALLRPDGIVGAILSGFSRVASLSFPQRAFGDAEKALRWLDIDPADGADLLEEVAKIRDAASGTNKLVRRLRTELATADVPSLDAAARGLGVSKRTFQRALREAGTTFRSEVHTAKLARAQTLLRESDRNVTWIAAELGFSSVQHFATAFRRAVGETPTAWRARHVSDRRDR